ncbi:hypothetical protein P153DRAFT_431538 [Dothidotthia symphoricarpi CBS 119687]|uniref:Heterokaryon incompatibility domain-containing protein n=1 Tax=Dothidotthia symphoricarpi CBS 119687 TaxID=1392245 RepID=A0A6A6AF10_9PLEO|nr:uncharacterized protein P153DRAFT_431538 [Dothidotthia symphoricarpi CBS 119687]KAF2129618.1 hypothetical protein P153DRAFT_431538 [Dothidotthia symphoricarpi CBS 119687]
MAMQSEARCLIERINREYTLNAAIIGKRFESLVSSCLENLSGQLYERSTHFLLEIIQNADDNTYATTTPTLSFSYKPGFLRIDCNEVGFTAENVEAICAISRSTEFDKATDGEYIGEKGIGFKSVFKAADTVWISSCDFTFKFDKTKFLGMVAPIWAEFPEPARPGWTSIYLELSKAYEEETLIHELLTFDANLLIFLRRIKEVDVRVADRNNAVWEQKFWKVESQQEGHRITVLHAGGSTFRYLIRSHIIENLPNELKRPNWHSTKIVLGFPMTETLSQPQLVPQNVYAFLPIRKYGLKFLLQGDFLLTASREDIESTLLWNRTIRDAVAEAFLISVHQFNKGDMKYVWPWYLPNPPTNTVSFFDPAIESILEQLKDLPVLESSAGTMEKASRLKYVPIDSFVDEEGNPFTLSEHTATGYLSSKYPSWAIEGVGLIGVSHLTPQEFLADLKSNITQDPQTFRTRSATWHSQLAETLVKLAADAELLSVIQGICLIPLNDGSWTSASGQSMFFSKGESSLEIPNGIEVLIVDSSAESDSIRRRLFVSLGVKAWEAPEICRLILQVHESPDFDAKRLTVDQLISHAVFLYKASWQPPKNTEIWFATMQNERCVGRELYINASIGTDSPASRIFAKLQTQFAVMHDDYRKCCLSDVEWPLWLVNNLGLSMVPRLVMPLVEPKPQPVQTADIQLELLESTGQAAHEGRTEMAQDTSGPAPQSQADGEDFLGQKPYPIVPQYSVPDVQPLVEMHPVLLDWQRQMADYQRQMMLIEQQNQGSLPIFEEGQDKLEQNSTQLRYPTSSVSIESNGAKEALATVDTAVPTGNAKQIFTLSNEFSFMFRECQSSDVLQVLRDNWHHYSQWIDGVHMVWQDPEFVGSSIQLRNEMGSCLVQSAKGATPLQRTVLPSIDPQLDEQCRIPTVSITDPKHTDWRLLALFGVVIEADIHYYLRCLIAISDEHHPDVDSVTYIYEKIQTLYKGNEELISAAFHERNIVLTHVNSSRAHEPVVWTNMKDCLEKNIIVEGDYPSCSLLFRCLRSPSGDPIASIVATATLIDHSSRLEDISRLFRDISKALQAVNTTQAAQLVQPLQNLSIFPITNGPGERTYDMLVSMHDTSWFIADRPILWKSFHGKIPLVALPTEDIHALEDLLRVLRLDSRLLSKLTTNRTRPVGKATTHCAWSRSLQAKSSFIKALIPHSHCDRGSAVQQIDNLRVSVVLRIAKTFVFSNDGTDIEGHSVDGQLTLSNTANRLDIFLAEDCAAAETLPYELVALLADAFEIKTASHRSLLTTVLLSSSMQTISSAFVQDGVHVAGLVSNKSQNQYRAQQGDLLRIPSPFLGAMTSRRGYGSGLPDALRHDHFESKRRDHDFEDDRRLPMKEFMQLDWSNFEKIQRVPTRTRGWEHTQHLGEHMVSKAFQAYLGDAYHPVRDWTSEFRSRSGHKPLESSNACAAFTMSDSKVVEAMTSFLTKFGQSSDSKWREKLLASSPVYHVDVIVNTGSKASPFVITSSQVERMRHLTMCDHTTGTSTDISILVRLSDVYSMDTLSVDLFINPWRLFNSGNLTLENDWILTGTLQDSGSGSMRKRRKLYTPSIPWDVRQALGKPQNYSDSRRGCQNERAYTYQAMEPEGIRLVHLLPGESVDSLQGVILHVSSVSPPPYRALSYVWGTDLRTHELMTPDGVLRITQSLDKALRSLRPKTQPLILWVDAICINQIDDREKEKQIRLMPQIFQNASFTYVFLDGDQDSDIAIETLMQIHVKAASEEQSRHGRFKSNSTHQKSKSHLRYENASEGRTLFTQESSENETDQEGWPDYLPKVPASWSERCIPQIDDDIWDSVKALFSLSWFHRVWIIQEVVMAHNVRIVCGRWIVDWSDLHHAMGIVDRQFQLADTDMTLLRPSWESFLSLAAQREWEARQRRWPLLMLLEHFRSAESTLSRDRLFALLGLACDGDEADFEPDYKSSLEEVLLRFARVFVRQGRGMQLLYLAGLNNRSHRFPSWIPDWTIRKPNRLHDFSEGDITFAASGPQQPVVATCPDTDELLVEGYTVDVIENISSSSNTEEDLALYIKEVSCMVDTAVLSRVPDSREALKWKVPIAGLLHPRVAVPGELSLESSYMALRKYIGLDKDAKLFDKQGRFINRGGYSNAYVKIMTSRSYLKQSASYIAALHDTPLGWRFVITGQGFVGTVPNLAQVGDAVVIMKGGRVPFVLRKSCERPGASRLVGGCYIHGLMNGEGLSLPGLVEHTFRIC